MGWLGFFYLLSIIPLFLRSNEKRENINQFIVHLLPRYYSPLVPPSHIYLILIVINDKGPIIIYQQAYVRMDIHSHLYLLINDTQAPFLHLTVLITAMWYPLRTYTLTTSHRNPKLLKRMNESRSKVYRRRNVYDHVYV